MLTIAFASDVIEMLVEWRLSRALEAQVDIEFVEIEWTQLSAVMSGIHVDDPDRLRIDIDHIHATVRWDELRWARLRPEIVVVHPQVTLWAPAAFEREQPAQQRGLDGFESIEIIDGTLRLLVPTHSGDASVEVSRLHGYLEFWEPAEPTAELDLEFELQGALDGGSVEVNGWLSSQTPADEWKLRFAVRDLDLEPLNPLWRDVLEMDLERGRFSTEGELERSPDRLRGVVQPHFEDMVMLGLWEGSAHPMGEVLFGQMLAGADSVIHVDRPAGEQQGSMASKLFAPDWKTIVEGIIRRGYARRLNEFEGYIANVEGVHTDFRRGLLELHGVSIKSADPSIEHPLVSVERIDVLFDREVIDPDALAHKNVVLWRPRFNFDIGIEGQANSIQFDESWLDQISALPYQTRTLVVHEGRIDLWDHRTGEPIGLAFVDDIELQGHEMAPDLHPIGVRGAQLSASGRIFGQTDASLNIVFEPKSKVPNLDLDMLIEPVPLTSLAPALQLLADVDVESGELGFWARLSAEGHDVEATITPKLDDIELRANSDQVMRTLLIERSLRKLEYTNIDLAYEMEPGTGLFHEFFPELLQAAFLGG